MPDIRWKRPDIKSTSLLPNVLARQQAKEAGAYEAWLVDDDGYVTEGSSSNAWIVDEEGVIVTRAADSAFCRDHPRARDRNRESQEPAARGAPVYRRGSFRRGEAFITGATTLVMPVVAIDGKPIGAGVPGPVALGLRAVFHAPGVAG